MVRLIVCSVLWREKFLFMWLLWLGRLIVVVWCFWDLR